jgi:hypothetical protein
MRPLLLPALLVPDGLGDRPGDGRGETGILCIVKVLEIVLFIG